MPAGRSTLPTPTGYSSEEVLFRSIFSDAQEMVPDLVWPESVRTYAQMRRDPQLAAILSSYTLPIRRATWQVNPAGCKKAVAQLVADDLGLPIAGEDKPKAARVQGVSWPEHLRTALLHLTFGHIPFELGATINDAGQARLTELAERMPYTVVNIEVDAAGHLVGIQQFAQPGGETKEPITADRLLWYVHDREGAAWQGTSLLRPCYGAWLMKWEMLRVAATSHRRFGMGVPTVTWDTGTSPTPGQYAQGQAAASAARVGDQSGLTLPPGAHLELIGLSGGVPDTQAFITFLDQQMSRSALAGFLDLGQSAHGSRALGQSFVDMLLLSIQAVAEYVADAVTRQVAARIVAWNYGDGEPVPAVEVGDVGADHEATAVAIGQMIGSGAIEPDPSLDAYLRREYKLPERTIPWVPPTPKGGAPPGGGPPGVSGANTGTEADTGAGGGNTPAARQSDLDWGLFGGSGA